MATARRFLVLVFILVSTSLLPGCAVAPIVPAVITGGSEYLSAQDRDEVDGEFLYQNANWDRARPLVLSVKLDLDYAEWTCASGRNQYVGDEVCLPPHQVKKQFFKRRVYFNCKHGRGGDLIGSVIDGADRYYCVLHDDQVSTVRP